MGRGLTVRDDLLGVSGRVGRGHAEDHDEGGVVGPGQVVGHEAAGLVVLVEEGEAEGAGDVGREEEQDEPGAGLPAALLDVLVGEDADKDADGDDGAVGDLHEGGD